MTVGELMEELRDLPPDAEVEVGEGVPEPAAVVCDVSCGRVRRVRVVPEEE